ncbi:DUF4083 family protein [Cytobacillus kochii]|uniref:DUF4083 family protein n=1 Tax=Cytobacillus kochii TaxID=859143 RepID=UPI0020408DEC|nr:DUF4083 family protein [Cytobacillus kochii]MCM3321249.1 DUF4083 domain-containing protein [Cytobacillus kochii]MCM3343917.1 DUF4083 domain-containing protein [Cytobacillus kochii]MDM5207760.1 DUF4083 family protein [Cytobacillus kochii]
MTGDMVFQIIMFLFLLAVLLIIATAVKSLLKKRVVKTNPDVEQKLDRIIELLERETNSK